MSKISRSSSSHFFSFMLKSIVLEAGETTTIGGYVAGLLIKNAEEAEVGVIVDDGEYIFQIVKMARGGVIETVSVERIDEKAKEEDKENK